MTPVAQQELQTAYEIGTFVTSLVQGCDWLGRTDKTLAWVPHQHYFDKGPNPYYNQTAQGIFLAVIHQENRPQMLHTRWGEWQLLAGPSELSYRKIWLILQNVLQLEKKEEYSTSQISLFAVRGWRGMALPEPIFAERNQYMASAIARDEVFTQLHQMIGEKKER